jgi:hypothetical protein
MMGEIPDSQNHAKFIGRPLEEILSSGGSCPENFSILNTIVTEPSDTKQNQSFICRALAAIFLFIEVSSCEDPRRDLFDQ